MTRIDQLKGKLAAREGKPGYKKNCEEIRREIARLESSEPPTQDEIDAAWKAAEDKPVLDL